MLDVRLDSDMLQGEARVGLIESGPFPFQETIDVARNVPHNGYMPIKSIGPDRGVAMNVPTLPPRNAGAITSQPDPHPEQD